jgi:predicted O-linked N-acetylglucosamine transferase (SPINDLY family)
MSRMSTQRPPGPSAHLIRAAQLLDQGQASQARTLIQQTLIKEPKNTWANQLMRHALTRLGEHEAALFYAQKVVKGAPDDPDAHNLLASSLFNLGRAAEAEQVLKDSLAKHPKHGLNHAMMTGVYAQQGRHVLCFEHCQKAFDLDAGNNAVIGNCVNAMLHLGMADNAVALLQQACQTRQNTPALMSLLCATMQYSPGIKPSDMLAAHFAFGRMLTSQMPRHLAPAGVQDDTERKLRIGFIAGNFGEPLIGASARALAEHLDRAAFDLALYEHSPTTDAKTQQSPAARTVRTGAFTPVALAERIIADGVDILVDLSGHTCTPILMAMHLRAAPVQVSGIGYGFTTGVPSIDWRIVDSGTDPEGAEKLASERLWRLDPIARLGGVPTALPALAPCPSLATSDNSVTFGCLADAPRINDAAVRTWGRLLRETTGSRLVLSNPSLQHEDERKHLLRRFEVSGVAPARIEIIPPTADHRERLALHTKVDIALDPFPASSPVHASEAMLMGAPVVTLGGTTSGRRACVPLLTAVGATDLIASDEEQYIEIARGLARDPGRRESLRASLRTTLAGSAASDAAAYAQRFGAMLRDMWRDHVKNAKSRLAN